MPLSILLASILLSTGEPVATIELHPEILGPAYHLGDFDGDGWVDAYVVDPLGTDRLFWNRGDGRFQDVSEVRGLAGLRGSTSALWLDFDTDGALDLYVSQGAGPGRLFQNTGAGGFVEISSASGLDHEGAEYFARTLDADGVGGPDLHVVTELGDVIFLNRGKGRFERAELPDVRSTLEADPSGAFAQSVESLPRLGSNATAQERAEFVRRARAIWSARRQAAASAARGGSAALSSPGINVSGTSIGSMPLASFPGLICAGTIIDQDSAQCIQASSNPAVGKLYPLSANFFVAATGNVGLGTTSPVHRLHVVSSASVAAKVVGSNAAGTWFDLDSSAIGGRSWGLTSTGPSSGEGAGSFVIRDHNAAQTRMTIRTDGKVGVGTNAPESQLHVFKGSAGATTAAANAVGVLENSSAAYLSFLTPDTTERGLTFSGPTAANNGGLYHNTTLAPNGFELRVKNSIVPVVVTEAGAVGIGTYFPPAPLAVAGGAHIDLNDTNTGAWASVLKFGSSTTGEGLGSKRTPGTGQWGLDFFTSSQRRMHISNGGDVGVGTNTPGHRLHVVTQGQSAAKFESNIGGGTWLELANTSLGSGDGDAWQLISTGSSNGEGAGKLLLRDGTTSTVAMTLQPNGFVGIGTSAPSAPLAVVGSAHVDFSNSNSGTSANTLKFGLSSSGEAIGSKRSGSGGVNGLDFYTNNALRMHVGNAGFVGVGTNNPLERLDVAGATRTQCVKITGGCDLAEPFETVERAVEAGMVVTIDPEHEGKVRVAASAYDTTVVGVVSGAGGVNTGMTMSQEGVLDMGAPIALVGRVYVWCDAGFGVIKPGDLLTSSATAGHAMKAADRERASGAILGKALTTLSEGRGLVLMVVTLQ